MNHFGLHFMFICYLIVLTSQNNATYQSKHLAKNSCEIGYQSLNNLQILSCKVSCNYRSVDGSVKCVDGAKQLTNLNECMQACCDANTFEMCLNESSQDKSTVNLTAIIVSVIIIPIVFTVSIYLYCKSPSIQVQTEKEVTELKVQQVIQKSKNGSIWLKKDNQQLQYIEVSEQSISEKQQSPCAICLQFDFNLKTSCGHSFHAHCFIDWLKRNQSCPLCVISKYNPVRIECQSCHNRQIRCHLYGSNPKLKQYKFMKTKENQKIICTKCGKCEGIQNKMQGQDHKNRRNQTDKLNPQNSMNIIIPCEGQNEMIENNEIIVLIDQA